MKTKSYKDLIVWQKAIRLVLLVYKLTRQFLSSELYGLTLQTKKAVVAIPSNIAEGYARQHGPEYIKFLSVAYASAAELETQLIIAEQLGYGRESFYKVIFLLLEEVSKKLNQMMRRLRHKVFPRR